MLKFEQDYFSKDVEVIVGIDEAGRGPLAGPVVSAAVAINKDFLFEEINDSKQLSVSKREKLFKLIIDNCLAYKIEVVSPIIIDEINILEATKLSMKNALNAIKIDYDLVLIDAVKLSDLKTPSISIIKGDAKAISIAAASILAKVYRDHLLLELDKIYPQYGFKNHKGYGTKSHIEAIMKYGPIKNVHRLTFAPIKNMNL